jgi:hypothetical protein
MGLCVCVCVCVIVIAIVIVIVIVIVISFLGCSIHIYTEVTAVFFKQGHLRDKDVT